MTTHQSERSFLIRDSIANLLRIVSLIALAVGLFAMSAGGVIVYLNLTGQLELERSDRAATQQADHIADKLSDIHNALRDSSVVDAARSGSNDSLRQALRSRGVVNILDARVLPPNIDAIAVDKDLDLGFAATEVVIEAIRNERAEVRVLEPGSPAESLTFAQRLPGDSGVLLLQLTVSVITSQLQPDDQLDFFALAQRSNTGHTVLDTQGRSAAAPIREIPISGSGLMLQWSRAVAQAPLDNRSAVILGCSGIIVLMVGLLLRRRTRLARYLARETPPDEARAAAQPAAANAGPRSRPHAGRRRATKTMVINPDAGNDRAKPSALPKDDETPTMVAPAPDLPEWLRDDGDSGLDELASDTDAGTAQPPPEPPFPDSGFDDDDELLEDFDDYQGLDPSLFRPDGIYGQAGKSLSVPEMVVLGQAIGSEAVGQGLRRICVAHDGRTSGPELLEGLTRGLSVSGIDVIDLGAVPTPVVWFAAMRMQQAGGVVVTGGNRGEEINGLEVVFDGLWLGREERRTLLDRIRNQEFATGAGERSTGSEADSYSEQLQAKQRLQRPLRVVLDCGSAVSGALAPELFEALGVDVIPLNADAETRPDQVAAFDSQQRAQDLLLCVDNFSADAGLAFDRTGSRLLVVAPGKGVVDPARLAALLALDLPEGGENAELIADEALAAKLGDIDGLVVTPINGDVQALQRQLREQGTAMAVHTDGSVCVAGDWHGLPDGIHAAAWLLAVLAADERPVAEILAPGPKGSDDPEAPIRE